MELNYMGWQEVEQLVTGIDYFTEVGRTKGADPAIKTDHPQEADSCWISNLSLELVLWSSETKTENDVNSEGTKMIRNSTQWDEVEVMPWDLQTNLQSIRAIKYMILLKEVLAGFPHLVIEWILTIVEKAYLHFSVFFIFHRR